MSEDLEVLMERRIALLDEWGELQREIAAMQAKSAALLAQRWRLMEDEIAVAPRQRDVIERSMIAEYSAAGRISKGSMEYAFSDARMLEQCFPAVVLLFESGRITPGHVREVIRPAEVVRDAIDEGTVSSDTLALYEAAVLEIAERDTAMRTRVHAAEVAAALAGVTVVQRQKRARGERTVTVRSVGDGLALLEAVLPEHLAVGIHDRLTTMARELAKHPDNRDVVLPPLTPADVGWDVEAGMSFGADTFIADPFGGEDPLLPDPADDDVQAMLASDPFFHADSPCITHVPADVRTMDQLRADLLTDLLLASDPSAAHRTGLDNITATIQVTVAAATLAGADDLPVQLDGTGPLHPDTARTLAGARAGWTRLFLDPTGFVTQTDTYTPSEPMRRYLRARDQHCRFPGCRQPVHRCETDHNLDYALGGPTAIDNLAHFCRGHHVLKHPDIPDAHRWTAHQLPDWSVRWTSPTGRDYADPPPRRVMFVPSAVSIRSEAPVDAPF